MWNKVNNGNVLGILDHPLTPATKSWFNYQPHVPTDNGTAGYSDVRKWLDVVDAICADMRVRVILAVGDQQSFSRLVWLKRFGKENYKHIIPLPGEFHGAVHILMAIHKLWWKPLIRWLVLNSEFCVESICEEWSSVELYNRYRFLYEGVICGIVAYFKKHFPGMTPQQIKLAPEYTSHGGNTVLLYCEY